MRIGLYLPFSDSSENQTWNLICNPLFVLMVVFYTTIPFLSTRFLKKVLFSLK